VLDGVMVEKDVTHPRMKRRIENPRIILLDCPLEYKKAESATNLEVRVCAGRRLCAVRASRYLGRAACVWRPVLCSVRAGAAGVCRGLDCAACLQCIGYP
jgi:hypothetical protein